MYRSQLLGITQEEGNLSISLSLCIYMCSLSLCVYIERERDHNARARLKNSSTRAALKLGHSNNIGTFQ
jgi:hypothetical protein